MIPITERSIKNHGSLLAKIKSKTNGLVNGYSRMTSLNLVSIFVYIALNANSPIIAHIEPASIRSPYGQCVMVKSLPIIASSIKGALIQICFR